MPITTENYYNIRRLNVFFLLSGLALLLITGWMMIEDQTPPWKYHQADFQRDVATLAGLELERYGGPEFQQQLDAARARVDAAEQALAKDEAYQAMSAQRAKAEARLQGAALSFNDHKAVLDVKRQDFERAVTLHGDVAGANAELSAEIALVNRFRAERERLEDEISQLKKDMKDRAADRDAAKKDLAALERKRDAAAARLALNEASLTNKIRNNLLDFAVKTIEVKQVVLPNVRSNLNFLDSFQVDRCQTCHIAIDRKEFTEEELVVSLSLSVAAANAARAGEGRPPIALPFALPAAARQDAGGKALSDDEYQRQLATLDERRERIVRDQWDALTRSGDSAKQKRMYEAVLTAFNELRKENGDLSPLELSHPLKAHPRLDLYVAPDSAHPLNKYGCTVCHQGNGQETSFTTAIHSTESHEQEEEWIHKYEGRIDYTLAHHWWTRPMLPGKYVEASCTKCHVQAADVAQHDDRPLATRITQGRQLFTQVGCINCHKVEGLESSRKVGPDLSHVATKLKPEFIQPWVRYPKDFRPSTWMPHFFAQENNTLAAKEPNDPDPNPTVRTETEIAAMSHWLMTFSTPFTPEAAPAGVKGDVESGRKLFDKVGCLACHAALTHRPAADAPSLGETWITRDLVEREGMEPAKALHKVRAMSLNEQSRYALAHFDPKQREDAQRRYDHTQWEQRKAEKEGRADDAARFKAEAAKIHVPPAFTRFGPELSGVGSKVSAEWLYDWLRNPRHYHQAAKMPRLRLSEQEALDVAAYLVTFKNDEFKQYTFDMNDERTAMADSLITQILSGQNSGATAERILKDENGRLTNMLVKLLKTAIPDESAAKARVEALDLEGRKLAFLGNKVINHYGCYSCHTIPGFEKATPPGTEMTLWAEKSITQLDFAFFEHMFAERRGESFEHLYPEEKELEHLVRDAGQKEIHVGHTHSSFAWHKLRNPRLWDRGKVKLPYDKLKMPNFFFNDDQADALTTFLLSRRRPFVTDQLVPQPASQMPAIADGRNLVAELNCVGCHNIEHNAATMHQYILAAAGPGAGGGEEEEEEASEEEESEKPAAAAAPKAASVEAQAGAIMAAHGPYDEVNGPPWLRGEGAKVQHAWLYEFLSDVQILRPWLAVRMPSFHLTNEQATTLVQYFAAVSKRESDRLRRELAPVDRYVDGRKADAATAKAGAAESGSAGDEWYREPQFRRVARYFSQYALDNRLANPLDFAVPPASKDAIATYASVKDRAAFFRDLYDVEYPFVATARPTVVESRFEAGREMTIGALNCLACHALGDPNVPGANKTPTAPNLSLTWRRLRPEWVHAWFQEPGLIQPGTKMPQWFPGGKSAFRDFPDKEQVESKFGNTGEDQMRLMLDFLYEAGARHFTGVRGAAAASQPAAQASAEGKMSAGNGAGAEQSAVSAVGSR